MRAGPTPWGRLLLYRGLLRAVLPFALPALWLRDRRTGKTRPSLASRLGRGLPWVEPGGVWIQAVSVGEVEVARQLVPELRQREPNLPLLVTSTTATGLERARSSLGDLVAIHPCPFDLGRPLCRVLKAARPRLVVLVETELWPELLHQAARHRAPVAIVNARLSEGSFTSYRRLGNFLRPLLAPLELVLARAEADSRRFVSLGVPGEKVVVAGNLKYEISADPEPLPWAGRLREWAAGRQVLVAGSTMEGEEERLLEAIGALPEAWKRLLLVLAPRHPERFAAVAQLLDRLGLATARRSDLGTAPEAPRVLLLDTIGELARAYGLAQVAFLGGSLAPTGGHNPLEAACWGVPSLSGPNVDNFREVYDELIIAGGARLVAGASELAEALDVWLSQPDAAAEAGARARAVVDANRGAAGRTADELIALWRSG